MTNSPVLGSEATAFDLLHPTIRRWIRDEGWTELRAVQADAVDAVIKEGADVVIAAATAAGKTEAAFLPVLTQVAARDRPGAAVLYVSPLKALINDQYNRLETLCGRMEINLVRWHGDAPQGPKARLRREPKGVVLITPESIEALFARRPGDALRIFGNLDFVIVDELHAFFQGVRGLHLACLLKRVDALSERHARRIGLSATIGDLGQAAAWLRPGGGKSVRIIEAHGDSPELRLQVRGYVDPPDGVETEPDTDDEDAGRRPSLAAISDHLFDKLRGSNNLVFAGSRKRVEEVADRLRERSEREGVPNEFFPHHGSLSKGLREELELRLKRGDLPTTAVATTTLELGIDLGSVKSVAQVGAPRSIASLRQRLGRSGRRQGVPAILRIYVREKLAAADAQPIDLLRPNVVRAVAAVRLLIAKFVEPPAQDPAVATTLLHQTLSLIAQRGGIRAQEAYGLLCRNGPLSIITPDDYADLLRAMASAEARLIEQAPDGLLMLGEEGERLVESRTFFALFETDMEWRLIASGRELGTIALSNAVGVGSFVVFAGRRWRVEAVDDRTMVLQVVPHRAGRIPNFNSSSIEPLHDRLLKEMRAVYLVTDVPAFLDPKAANLLKDGRTAFQQLGLDRTQFVACGANTEIFTWRGTATNSVLEVALLMKGRAAESHDLGVSVFRTTPTEALDALQELAHSPPTSVELAAFVAGLRGAMYDQYVPEDLLRTLWARRYNATIEEFAPFLSSLLAQRNRLLA